MKIHDITRGLYNGIAAWPGDTPYQFDLAWKISEGSPVNVGAIKGSVHTGTHADAPYHFLRGGKTIEQLSLAPFIGPAVVIDVGWCAVIGLDAFRELDFSATPRVLLKTGAWPDTSVFPDAFPCWRRAWRHI